MIRILAIAGAAVLISALQVRPQDEKAPGDAALQGRWKLVGADDSDGLSKKRGFAPHIMVIKGREMWEEPGDGADEVRRRFKLDPSAMPKQIDFRTDGRGKDGQMRFGVYALDGSKLRICFSSVVPADEARRPGDFAVPPGSGRVLLVYERIKE